MAPISSTLTQQIVGYLKAVHQVYQDADQGEPRIMSSESLVLRYGCSFNQRVPARVKGTRGRCFQTCYDAILQDSNLTYCEGYAICKGLLLPVLHSWLVSAKGEVHDPTWNEKNTAYFGIELEREFVLETVALTQSYGIIQGDSRLNFPLHRQGFPIHAIARQFHPS